MGLPGTVMKMTNVRNRPARSNASWIASSLVLVVITVAVAWFAFGIVTSTPIGTGSGTSPGASTSPAAPAAPVHQAYQIYLTINANPANGWPQYTPANFSVPSGTLVEFVITNYDNGSSPVAAQYAQVNGTVGNTMTLNGTQTVHSVNPNVVAHTFTFMSGAYAGFNVPIPVAAGAGGSPTVVTFQAYFNQTGTFTWNCMAPCGSGPMSTPGFMTGTLTVL